MSLRPIWRRLKRSPSRKRDPSPKAQTTNKSDTQPATPVPNGPVKTLSQADDLWIKAEKDLRDDPQQRKFLDNAANVLEQRGLKIGTSGSRSHQQLCSFLEEKSRALEDKKWMVGDHEFASKAQLVKIFQHVLMVKDIVNTAASISPPAAIACAGLTVTLTLFIQSATEQKTLIDGLDKTSALIPRIYEMQKLYLRSDSDVNLTEGYMPQLMKALTAICGKVLEFHARALCYFDKSSVSHTLRGMFKQDPWSDLVQDMQSLESEIERFTRLIDAAEMKSGWQNWTERDEKLQEKIEAQQVWQTNQARDGKITRFLRTLYTCPYRDRKDRNRERVLGTCEWFTSHDLFTNWNLSHESCLLWVSADPGCGKSVLTKYLVDQVLPGPDRTICYFFFKDDFPDQRNATAAISSLLRQLIIAQPSLLKDSILEKAETDGNKLISSLPDLWDMLISTTNSAKAGEVIFVVDALDECCDDERNRLIDLVTALYLRSNHSSNLKFLITSRPYGHIRSGFRQLEDRLPTIHLSGESGEEADQIATEINLVVESMTEEIANDKNLDDDERHFLAQLLKPIPNRTYLWVTLTLGYIKETDGFTKGNVRRALGKNIPQSVNDAYEKILDRSPDHAKARFLLHIILAAERPLTLEELSAALAVQRANQSDEEVLDEKEPVERFKTTVRDLCGLLLWISDGKVYLLHQTVKEFLSPLDPSLSPLECASGWKGSFTEIESNRVLGKRCVWALASNLSVVVIPEFLLYADHYWDQHLRRFLSSNAGEDEHIVDLGVSLCTPGSEALAIERWADLYCSVEKYNLLPLPRRDGATSLTLAAQFGLGPVVRRLLNTESVAVNSVDRYGDCPLSLASGKGHTEVVRLLLESEQINADIRTVLKQSPLSMACEKGHLEVVKLLLATGQVDIDSRDELGRTPLSLSSKRGHFDIVKLLLATGQVDIDSRDELGRTPLSLSSKQGHFDIVKLLLATGQAETDSKDENGRTPLFHSSKRGHFDIMKLLLTAGQADSSLQDRDGMTPLINSAQCGNLDAVKLLVEVYSEKTDVKDEMGRCPLSYACEAGHLEMVKFFLTDDQLEIAPRDKSGKTPFTYAVSEGRLEIVELLLATGQVEIDSKDDYGVSPLLSAAENGHVGMVKFLLATGQVEIDSKDKHGRAILSYVAKRGHLEIMKLLATGAVGIDSKDDYGMSPLSLAAKMGHVEMVKFLLGTGQVDIDSKDGHGMSPLSLAAKMGHVGMVKFLLGTGRVDIDSKDAEGYTPLAHSCIEGDYCDLEIVKLLLATGQVDVDSKDIRGEAILSHVARKGHFKLEIAKMLIDAGAVDIDSKDCFGKDAISYASEAGHSEIVELLNLELDKRKSSRVEQS